MTGSLEYSIFRHVNLTKIIDYIVTHDLNLNRFEINGDYVIINVSGDDFGVALFEELLDDLHDRYDEAMGLV